MRWFGVIAAGMLGLALIGLPTDRAVAVEGAATPDYWLLTEFDWGDDPETVKDSLTIAPGWFCVRVKDKCRFVKVKVDGEDLLAHFHYVALRLDRVTILTPDLDRAQAEDHMKRVWETLSGYVGRFKGEADVARSYPALDALPADAPAPTHYWMTPDMQIRIELGRNGEKYYVAAHFYPPHEGR
jgi:hypothetical protein